MRRIVSLSCFLFLAGPPVLAVDYDRLERRLIKEPAYQTRNPGYALLLFGREARLQVWVVLDGPALLVDLNGDGDLTAKNERFASLKECQNVTIADPDGKTRYVLTRVATHNEYFTPKELQGREAQGIRAYLSVDATIIGSGTYQQHADIQDMWDDPRKAQIAHFHGPLTIEVLKYNFEIPPGLKLKPVDGMAKVIAVVGTMSKKHGCWVVVGSTIDPERRPVPNGLHPVVEIDFPPADPKAKPIRRKYELTQFC